MNMIYNIQGFGSNQRVNLSESPVSQTRGTIMSVVGAIRVADPESVHPNVGSVFS